MYLLKAVRNWGNTEKGFLPYKIVSLSFLINGLHVNASLYRCRKDADAAVLDDHSNSARNNLPDIGAVLCLMGHMQRASGDSKRAMDTYIEALKANPYLWEAFDGLIELGMTLNSHSLI